MGGNYFANAGTFLVDTIFGIYMLIVLLRLLFQIVRADFYNPVSQMVVQITNPPVLLLRRLIPGLWGIDMASVVLLFILGLIKLYLVQMILNRVPAFPGALLWTLTELLQLLIWVFIVAILIRIVISWINPTSYNPVMSLLNSLTEPLMGPARRLLPPFSGLDLSPILVFIVLYLSLFLIVQPLLDVSVALAYR